MSHWTRGRRGTLRITYTPAEKELLGTLAATLADTLMGWQRSAPRDELSDLTGIVTGHTDTPTDPGLARLLPNFTTDDDAPLLRSLHEPDIIRGKLDHLLAVTTRLAATDGLTITIPRDDAAAWVAALTDIRLYLHEHKEQQLIMDWLGYQLESLLTAWRR